MSADELYKCLISKCETVCRAQQQQQHPRILQMGGKLKHQVMSEKEKGSSEREKEET